MEKVCSVCDYYEYGYCTFKRETVAPNKSKCHRFSPTRKWDNRDNARHYALMQVLLYGDGRRALVRKVEVRYNCTSRQAKAIVRWIFETLRTYEDQRVYMRELGEI